MNCEYEIAIDGFTGGGGASTGIEMAGLKVAIAINHDPDAIEMHAANHPDTVHYNENIWKVKPLEATKGRPVGLAWFSPDCTHHSRAKGSKPVENKRRGLAWVVVHWAKLVRPRVIILENVPEFKEWGPLIQKTDKHGNLVWRYEKSASLYGEKVKVPWMVPDPARKGMTYKLWMNKLRGMGYHVEDKMLVAADYGSPTIRKRLFMIARCDGQPIVWPKPTHGNKAGLLPYRTAAECIDWSIPCPSIFGRKKPLAENTLKRIAKGIQKFVIDNPNPFIIGIDNKSSGDSAAWNLFEPVRTITQENRFALISPVLAKYHGQKQEESRCYPVTEPIRTIDTQNRFGALTVFLSKYFGGVVGSDIKNPVPTVTTIDHNAIVATHLTKFYKTNIGSDMLFPVPTITASGQHIGEVRTFLVKYYGTGDGADIRDPMHTVTSKERFGLVTVNGEQYQISDIGLRMLQPRELARAQGFPESYILTGTKTNQVAKIGNSVCPHVACALVKANVQLRKLSQSKVG